MTLASLRLTIASRQNLTLVNHDRRYRCFIDPSDKDYHRLTLHNCDHFGLLEHALQANAHRKMSLYCSEANLIFQKWHVRYNNGQSSRCVEKTTCTLTASP